jgi:protein-S-isoprenylcysteine O-methyltransferase Ste14
MIWLRALGFVLLVQATAVGLVPWWLAPRGPRLALGAWRAAGLPLLAAGLGLLLVCNVYFVLEGRGTAAPYDPPRELVVRGPYRYVRNPMYLGASLIVLGLALWRESLSLLGYAALLSVAYRLFVRFFEEPSLERRFGAAYDRYRRQVPPWLPGRSRSPSQD